MRQTLFHIPEQLGPLPLFGWYGWASLAWIGFAVVLLVWLGRREETRQEIKNYLPVLGIVWLAIAFVLPMLMEAGQGVPIRGYGVMLLIAVVCGVALAAWQARRMGVDPEIIFSLAFVLFITAIVGARVFYVIQYWEQFSQLPAAGGGLRDATPYELARGILNVTQGGLVVYGSLIGGLAGGVWYLWTKGLPILAIGDLIAPSLLVGLSIGRLGCLMNGCCFGGVCETSWVGPIPVAPITFPAESPPYQDQRHKGLLQGIAIGQSEAGLPTVAAIDPHGPAADSGLKVGDVILHINKEPVLSAAGALRMLESVQGEIDIDRAGGEPVHWNLPPRSLPVYPTQIYSSINAALLALLLWMAYPFRPRDGFIIALLLTIYPMTRFLLEVIRTDEPGRWGTQLTISQFVSLGIVVLSLAVWVLVMRQPPQLAFPPAK